MIPGQSEIKLDRSKHLLHFMADQCSLELSKTELPFKSFSHVAITAVLYILVMVNGYVLLMYAFEPGPRGLSTIQLKCLVTKRDEIFYLPSLKDRR